MPAKPWLKSVIFLFSVVAARPAFGVGTELGYPDFSDDDASPSPRSKDDHAAPPAKKRSETRTGDRFAFQSRFAVGMGLNIPDILPIEGYWLFASRFGVRLFYVPTVPFNIRVEMPRDVISSSNGIIIEHPALNIRFKAKYGPQYGVEAMYFPFENSFYLSGGTSFRKLNIAGGVESPLIITSQGGGASAQTNSLFGISADATTSQWVTRAALGWMFETPGNSYCNVTLIGVTQPKTASSSIGVAATVRNPTVDDTQEMTQALKEVKAKKESELEEKALEAMKPVEKLVLPIIGFTFGFYF